MLHSPVFFRPYGAGSFGGLYPRLAPWAVFFRRCAAGPAVLRSRPKCIDPSLDSVLPGQNGIGAQDDIGGGVDRVVEIHGADMGASWSKSQVVPGTLAVTW